MVNFDQNGAKNYKTSIFCLNIDFPKTSRKITSPTIKNAALSILDLRDDVKLTYTPQTFNQESKYGNYK